MCATRGDYRSAAGHLGDQHDRLRQLPYRYASGREGDTFLTGFAPRKQNLTLYIVDGFERHAARLAQLGPHTLGKGCLYLKSLRDVDLAMLLAIVGESITHVSQPADEAG